MAKLAAQKNGWTQSEITAIETFYEANGRITGENLPKLLATDAFADRVKNSGEVTATRSVRQKTVSLGYYKKAETKRVVGAPSSVRKIEFVRGLETKLSMPQGSLDSFEKGSKPALEAINKAVDDRMNAIHAEYGLKEPEVTES